MCVPIIDDEQLARERLRLLLGAFDDLQIVREAGDGEEAIERIGEVQPDLVLLDIQMAGSSGIEVASSLPSPHPKIIFCTAFDQYAVDAFELAAVDYLLKPVNRARLADAIERARALNVAEVDANVDLEFTAKFFQRARDFGRSGFCRLTVWAPDIGPTGSWRGRREEYIKSQRNHRAESTSCDEFPERYRRTLPNMPEAASSL
jgi:DNA-binding LytR/AlgR family response regulator